MLFLVSIARRKLQYNVKVVIYFYNYPLNVAKLEFSNLNLLSHLLYQKLLSPSIQARFSSYSCLSNSNDYYKLLNVSKTTSAKQIKSAYYEIAKQCHPDVTKGDSEAVETFRKVSEAYEVLSNNQKRAEYDELISSHPYTRNEDYCYQNPMTDIYEWENIDPDENFEQKFGKWTNKKRDKSRRGASSDSEGSGYSRYSFVRERTINISLIQAAKGISRNISIPHPLNKFNQFKAKNLFASVNIHPGVADKQVLRVVIDQIMEVFVTIRIKPSKGLRRIGANVYSTATLSYAHLTYGGKVLVEGLYGELELEIPAGTHSHTNFRLSKQGFKMSETSQEYGDHLVLIKIKNFNKSNAHKRKHRHNNWKRKK